MRDDYDHGFEKKFAARELRDSKARADKRWRYRIDLVGQINQKREEKL